MVRSDRSIPRRSFHRRVFVAAGIYNLLWGAFSVLDPQWFFRVSDMPAANHPQIFASLGMVIALYGILYLEVARVPGRSRASLTMGLELAVVVRSPPEAPSGSRHSWSPRARIRRASPSTKDPCRENFLL